MGYMSDQQKIRFSENSEKKTWTFSTESSHMAMFGILPPKKSEVFQVTWPCWNQLFLDGLTKGHPRDVATRIKDRTTTLERTRWLPTTRPR